MSVKLQNKTGTGRRKILETGEDLRETLRALPGSITTKTIAAGTVAALFSCTGPPLIIMNSAAAGNLSTKELTSWIFAVYFFGGILSLFLSLNYRQPLVGAFSIPGTVLVGTSLTQITFSQAIGAYIISGLILLVLGLSGVMERTMRFLPQPIVMGTIAGTLIHFGTGIIKSAYSAPLLGSATLISYFLTQRLLKRVPPILGALIGGLAVLLFKGNYNFELNLHIIGPSIFFPDFVPKTILSVSLPLVVLVLGSENAQAIGVSEAHGYHPPVNMITILSGLASVAGAFLGAHSVNMAGVSTAICAAPGNGDRKGRYSGSIIAGILFISFGILNSPAVAFIKVLPLEFINVIAGLSMIGVLIGAFELSFSSKRFRTGAIFSLLIAMSGINIFFVSAPFWSLVGGVLVSYITEPHDFNPLKS